MPGTVRVAPSVLDEGTYAGVKAAIEVHHIAVRIDLKTWFHGVDFSQLEAVDGVVLFDETHNAHRYEHMVNDHTPESLSLALAD